MVKSGLLQDSDDDDDMSEDELANEQENEQMMDTGKDDADYDSEIDDEDLEAGDDVDQLQAPSRFDIPMASNIPVVSQLAKEKSKDDIKEQQMKQKKDKINQIIEKEDLELETHFVDNPFIRMREKANRKQLESKMHLQADDLEQDEN